jgi:hypothetical protein
MKNIFVILLGFLLTIPCASVFSQNKIGKTGAIETVGAGFIDLILRNPKADKLNATQRNGLSTLGTILNIFGQRKHEVNVATSAAGQGEIIINNNIPAGNQGQSSPQTQENSISINSPDGPAQIIMDAQENLYLVYKGNAYSISKELINQAKEFSSEERKNKFLEPYNLKEIEKNFNFSSKKEESSSSVLVRYKVKKRGGEYLPDIAKAEGVHEEDIKIRSYRGPDTKSNFKHIFEGSKKLTKGSVLEIRKKEFILLPQINFIFLCKWANDFSEDGYQLKDFQGIRNSFSKGENFLIVTGYKNNLENCEYSLEIFDYETGKKIFEKTDISPMKDVVLSNLIDLRESNQGIYIINFKLKRGGTVLDSKTEKFEIIEITQ